MSSTETSLLRSAVRNRHPLPASLERVGVGQSSGTALHLGSRHTICLQNLSRLLVHHSRGLHPCPLCDEQGQSIPIIDHVISAHKGETGLNIDLVDRLLLLLVDGDIPFVYKF